MCLRKRYSNTPNFNEKLEQDLKRARRSSRCRRMRAPPQRNLHATIDQIHAVSVGAVAAAAPDEDERRRRISHDVKLETIPNCEPSTKPTAEDVRSWAQSFDKLMKTPSGRNVFREFLRTEYSEENMLFWLACEDLKNEANKSAIEEKARMIYEDFISILSPKEVSLDSRVRDVINKKMAEPSTQTFDDAQLQIYTLMHRDSYPRFLNSSIYKSLFQRSSSTSSES
ncbi:regulator of G-protein signaling 19 isoform X2 [Chiloscyllium punctatum]|uniref:regulator of G-protein signaling 19 isoform X2 n=1 Tax=Chiloscyllium punctatum TaxID=137246 RepID=UPI003B63490E